MIKNDKNFNYFVCFDKYKKDFILIGNNNEKHLVWRNINTHENILIVKTNLEISYLFYINSYEFIIGSKDGILLIYNV